MSLRRHDLNREETQATCENVSTMLFEEKLILLTGKSQKTKQETTMRGRYLENKSE